MTKLLENIGNFIFSSLELSKKVAIGIFKYFISKITLRRNLMIFLNFFFHKPHASFLMEYFLYIALRDLYEEGNLNTCLYICKYMVQVKKKGVSFKLKHTQSLCHVNSIFVVHLRHQLCTWLAVLSGKYCCRRNGCCKYWLTVL